MNYQRTIECVGFQDLIVKCLSNISGCITIDVHMYWKSVLVVVYTLWIRLPQISKVTQQKAVSQGTLL